MGQSVKILFRECKRDGKLNFRLMRRVCRKFKFVYRVV